MVCARSPKSGSALTASFSGLRTTVFRQWAHHDPLWLALAAEVPVDDSRTRFAIPNWSDIVRPCHASASRCSARRPLRVREMPLSSWACRLAPAAWTVWRRCTSDADQFEEVASRIREDGMWIDAGENDNTIVQTLINTPTAFGVFGFSFLDQNSDRLVGTLIDGVAPEFDAIADGEYPISRSLFFYVKNQHSSIVPDWRPVAVSSPPRTRGVSWISHRSGLIPLPDALRDEMGRRARILSPMTEVPG